MDQTLATAGRGRRASRTPRLPRSPRTVDHADGVAPEEQVRVAPPSIQVPRTQAWVTPGTMPERVVVEVEHEVGVAVPRSLVELARVLEVAPSVDLGPTRRR